MAINIKEVTWYSRIAALIIFLGGVPVLTFFLGMKYQAAMGDFELPLYFRAHPAVESRIAFENPMDGTYFIEGERVRLTDGMAESPLAPGSAEKMVTKYFGNDLRTDLNGDGETDVAFIVTQQRGGSGTFYYAVGAVMTPRGYVGTDGYFLGDRIAPQATNESTNPRHVDVVVFNFADRKPGEPMTAKPSVGKSAYLKLDSDAMRWAVVMPDFEGESR